MDAVEFEIDYLTDTARLLAYAIKDNHNLIEAIEDNDRDRISEIAGDLRETAQLDFCTVVDSEGIVLKRVHAPERYGDSLTGLSHIQYALEGRVESLIVPGVTIGLGIMAGSPIINENGVIVGAISLGYMMDIQDFTFNLKNHTGCEVTIFLGDKVISSTILDKTGHTDLGGSAAEHISKIVLEGGTYLGTINLFGDNILGLYHPLFGVDNKIVGMAFVGFYTAEDTVKILTFIIIGTLVTLVVLCICLLIARKVSAVIEKRLDSMMKSINDTQEDLRIARDAAETESEAKSVFLANMSHEIRTPMNSIIGFAELAEDCKISEDARGYISNIRTSSDVLLNIINDILDISKIESRKIKLENIPFSLFDVFEHCQNTVKPIIAEKNLTLYCYSEPLTGKRLLGDPFRLRQIIMNLLSNAAKFTNVGMIKALASIQNIDTNKATIRFEIKDSGIGISPEHLKSIFKPFAQADDTVTRRFGGTGLGLTITKNIVELMGGKLNVQSDIGVGSTFSFDLTFELTDETADTEYEVVKSQELTRPVFKGEVLICEDNALNQQVICEHLLRVGVKTVIANNGKEGIDIISKRMDNPFDIIFMDIHMPVMDGLEAASKIVEMGITTPLVALTANIMAHEIVLYREAGMRDTLGKPFTSLELWDCLLRYLPVTDGDAISTESQATNDNKLKKQLMEHFVKSHPKTFDTFIQAINSGDIKQAHRVVHTLKGNASQIDEEKLSALAKAAEDKLDAGSDTLDDELKNNLKTELDIVLEKLAPLLTEAKERNAVKNVEYDPEKTRKLYNTIEPLLKEHSYDTLQFIDELIVIPGSEDLVKSIENLEFKHALELLTELKRNLE